MLGRYKEDISNDCYKKVIKNVVNFLTLQLFKQRLISLKNSLGCSMYYQEI